MIVKFKAEEYAGMKNICTRTRTKQSKAHQCKHTSASNGEAKYSKAKHRKLASMSNAHNAHQASKASKHTK